MKEFNLEELDIETQEKVKQQYMLFFRTSP